MTLIGLPLDAAFWATVALVLFIVLVLYLKVPAMIGKQLDNRIARIEDVWFHACRLRASAITTSSRSVKGPGWMPMMPASSSTN